MQKKILCAIFDLIPREIVFLLEVKSCLNSPHISSDTALLMNILKKNAIEHNSNYYRKESNNIRYMGI